MWLKRIDRMRFMFAKAMVVALARRFRSLTHVLGNSFRVAGAKKPGGSISKSPSSVPSAAIVRGSWRWRWPQWDGVAHDG